MYLSIPTCSPWLSLYVCTHANHPHTKNRYKDIYTHTHTYIHIQIPNGASTVHVYQEVLEECEAKWKVGGQGRGWGREREGKEKEKEKEKEQEKEKEKEKEREREGKDSATYTHTSHFHSVACTAGERV